MSEQSEQPRYPEVDADVDALADYSAFRDTIGQGAAVIVPKPMFDETALPGISVHEKSLANALVEVSKLATELDAVKQALISCDKALISCEQERLSAIGRAEVYQVENAEMRNTINAQESALSGMAYEINENRLKITQMNIAARDLAYDLAAAEKSHRETCQVMTSRETELADALNKLEYHRKEGVRIREENRDLTNENFSLHKAIDDNYWLILRKPQIPTTLRSWYAAKRRPRLQLEG